VLARSAPHPHAQPLLSDWGDGERGVEAERAQKAICSPSARSLRFPFSPHKHPSPRLRALLYGNRAEGAARGAGRQESRVLTPSQTPGHLTEGKDDVSAGTLSEWPSPKGRECPPWLTGGASDGREPHSQAAPQAKWSLRIQAEPPYLRRLCRTAPSTSPGGGRACSCRHRGEEESAHTETTDIERYVVSFSFTAPHYTTRPDLGCSSKDLSLHAIHATTSPIRLIQGSGGTFIKERSRRVR
jgi:hypothetical protein